MIFWEIEGFELGFRAVRGTFTTVTPPPTAQSKFIIIIVSSCELDIYHNIKLFVY